MKAKDCYGEIYEIEKTFPIGDWKEYLDRDSSGWLCEAEIELARENGATELGIVKVDYGYGTDVGIMYNETFGFGLKLI